MECQLWHQIDRAKRKKGGVYGYTRANKPSCMLNKPLIQRRLFLEDEAGVEHRGEQTNNRDADHQRLVDQVALPRTIGRSDEGGSLQRQVQRVPVGFVVSSMLNAPHAVAAKHDGQSGKVQHHPAEHASHQCGIIRKGMCFKRIAQCHQADPNCQDACREQGMGEYAAPALVSVTAFFAYYRYPHGDQANGACHDMQGYQCIELPHSVWRQLRLTVVVVGVVIPASGWLLQVCIRGSTRIYVPGAVALSWQG